MPTELAATVCSRRASNAAVDSCNAPSVPDTTETVFKLEIS